MFKIYFCPHCITAFYLVTPSANASAPLTPAYGHIHAQAAVAGISIPRPFKVLDAALVLQEVEVCSQSFPQPWPIIGKDIGFSYILLVGPAFMEQTPRKRGQPRLPVTEELIEARRLSKQRRNRQQRGGSEMETPRQRTNIDKRKREFASSNTILDIGAQDQICGYYDAVVWAAEFTGRHVGPGPKGYSICCSKGKVLLPLLQPTPPELAQLLNGSGRKEVKFRGNSRMYNNVFALCSFGGSVDESINNGSSLYVFRVNNHVYHSIGSLLPSDGRTPKYAQFYMYNGQEVIEHRLHFPHTRDTLDPDVVALLLQMLNRENALVGIFKQLRERYPISQQILVKLRLLERRSSDGRYVNIPGGNDYEFTGLAVD
ncbi:hypothetical protein POM88_043476 [Heracleum sosnowskyi]|uniref:Uncharacterized protein n=1 Tax=Heracleum sosnowskyi TaxID=360622 RepID=A0AAD8H146_9APIA|nr:hypothetical protein POM88_043476 [Heracleum sosnowskyi]